LLSLEPKISHITANNSLLTPVAARVQLENWTLLMRRKPRSAPKQDTRLTACDVKDNV
jgi:hypothetical protein